MASVSSDRRMDRVLEGDVHESWTRGHLRVVCAKESGLKGTQAWRRGALITGSQVEKGDRALDSWD